MNIYNVINKLNAMQNRLRLLRVIFQVLVASFVIIEVVTGFFPDDQIPDFATSLIWLSILIFIIVIVLFLKTDKEYKRLFKGTFVVDILSNHFNQVVYEWEKGYSKEQVKSFGLSRLANKFNSEDYLRGEYKGIHFSMSDVSIVDASRNKSTTIFHGRMLSFDFPKYTNFNLQIYSNNFKYASKDFTKNKLQTVSLESAFFNSTFTTKAVNTHEAFYVLTPPFMKRLQDLKEKYRTIIINIANGHIYIGLEGCSDTFDYPIDSKLEYLEAKALIEKDIQDIMDVIDTLTQDSVKSN